MECRTFDLTVSSAIDVTDVRLLGKTEVHARIYIAGLPEAERRTPTDTHGKRNPAWNFTTNYTVFESMLMNSNTVLVVKLYCTRSMGDRYIGEVNMALKELFERAEPDKVAAHKSSKEFELHEGEAINRGRSALLVLPLQKGSVKSQGNLIISYSFSEKVTLNKLLMATVATRMLSPLHY
ncbi:hypothetical protein ABFX02_14G317500 [Erythranthe guttata]